MLRCVLRLYCFDYFCDNGKNVLYMLVILLRYNTCWLLSKDGYEITQPLTTTELRKMSTSTFDVTKPNNR